MQEYAVKSFADFHGVVWKHRPMHGGLMWLYRGQSRADWPLVPKAGRPPYDTKNDLLRLREWKANARPYVKDKPDSIWEWLALAQHYGFATRLLDWSYNPLVALYFCVIENEDCDGAVYVHFSDIYVNDNLDPMTANGVDFVATFRPPIIDARIKAQSAMFTFHGRPNVPMTSRPINAPPMTCDNLYKIVVPKIAKQVIKIEIDMYGITDDFIYPGLEGVSKYINRCTAGIHMNEKYMS